MSTGDEIDISEYLDVFLEETREHLQTVTQALIDFEEADAERATEVLNELFRAAHTIKGMSASMGFGNMERLCHSMEDVMDEFRSGSRSVTPEIIDLLLECSTKLGDLAGSIEENKSDDDVDISMVLTELNNLMASESGRSEGEREEQGTEAAKAEISEEKEEVVKAVDEAVDNVLDKVEATNGSRRTYEINVSIDRSCDFKGARGFLALNNLAEMGKIISTTPSQEDIENDNFDSDFKVVLAADTTEDEVNKVLASIADIEKFDILSEEKEEVERAIDKAVNDATDKVEATNGSRRTYEINVSIDRSCDFKGARGFLALNNLAEMGKIISTTPSQEDIENDNFDSDFKVVLAADASEEDVEKVLSSVADVEKVEISEEKKEVDAEKKDVAPAPKGVKSRGKGTGAGKGRSKESAGAAKSVRISFDKLDVVVNLVGELVINKSRLIQIGKEHEIADLSSTMAVVERTISDLQYEVTQMKMLPVEHVFNRFPKLVRDLYRAMNKEVEFILEGKEIELDRTVLDEIVDPVVHLLRNSVDHGIELPEEREGKGKSRKGMIKLAAQRETGHVAIIVEDDGKGLDANALRDKAVKKGLLSSEEATKLSDEEAYKLIFMPGFSTAEQTTEVSGRGVGMGVVKTKVEALGGLIEIHSKVDVGTRIMLKLPLTTAIIQALLVNVCDKTYAIPLANVREIISVSQDDISTIQGEKVTTLRGSILPLAMLRYLFDLSTGANENNNNHNKKLVVVIVERSDGRIGLVVDAALEQQEIVVKPPDERLQGSTGLGGFTILGDGNVIPIVDIATLALA